MAPTPTRRRFLKTSTLAAGAGLAGCLLGVPTTDRICGDRSPDPVEPTVADVRDRSLGDQPAGSEWPLERANPGKTGVTDAPGPRGDVGHFWRWAPRTEYESPVWVTVADGRLYASSLDGDVLYALDPATATDQWRYDGLDSAGMPAVLGSSGERTVVVGAATGLHAVDAATGTRRWHRPGDTYDHDATLSGRDGVVYADGRDKLRAVDVETGEQLWTGGPNGHIGAVTRRSSSAATDFGHWTLPTGLNAGPNRISPPTGVCQSPTALPTWANWAASTPSTWPMGTSSGPSVARLRTSRRRP